MSKSRTVSTRLLPILLLLFAFGPRALAQDDSPKDRTARDDSSSSPARIVVPVPASPDFQNPPSTTSEARSFLIDILKDQKAIYTSPAHIKKHDLKFLIPIAATTAVLLATDHQSGDEITERPAKDLTGFSYHLGQATDVPTAVALIGGTYLASRVFHKDRLRETARLMAEAEIDSAILVNIIKVSARRERPSSGAGEGAVQLDEARGRFEVGGSSFPSGHSIEWFTMASVVAEEYRDKPLIAYSAYGVAAVISASRVSARQHFVSDVFVGGTLGYLIGHYVVRVHSSSNHPMPTISPIFNQKTNTYGVAVGLHF